MSSSGPAQNTTTAPPSWLQDYGRSLLDAGSQAAQQPYQPYGQQRVADLSPLQSQSLAGIQGLGAASIPYLGQAASSLSGMLSGDMNPYAQQVGDRTAHSVTDAFNAATAGTSGRFNSPGNWGSERHGMADERNARALSTGLGDAYATAYGNAYQNAQTNKLGAASGLGSLLNTGLQGLTTGLNAGNVQRQQQQSLLDSLYGDFTEQRDYPWQQIQRFGSLLGVGGGAAGSNTARTQNYDPISQGLGLMQLGSGMSNKGGSGSGVTPWTDGSAFMVQ